MKSEPRCIQPKTNIFGDKPRREMYLHGLAKIISSSLLCNNRLKSIQNKNKNIKNSSTNRKIN